MQKHDEKIDTVIKSKNENFAGEAEAETKKTYEEELVDEVFKKQ